MIKMKVQVINLSKNELPNYATPLSAGMDLRADFSRISNDNRLIVYGYVDLENNTKLTLYPGTRVLIPTGLKIALPEGYEARIQPRSGLALKKGISVVNSPGCVDADYREEIGVILINHGTEPFVIESGDRIAQMIVSKVEHVEFEEVDCLTKTDRDGGFGSTGAK